MTLDTLGLSWDISGIAFSGIGPISPSCHKVHTRLVRRNSVETEVEINYNFEEVKTETTI